MKSSSSLDRVAFDMCLWCNGSTFRYERKSLQVQILSGTLVVEVVRIKDTVQLRHRDGVNEMHTRLTKLLISSKALTNL